MSTSKLMAMGVIVMFGILGIGGCASTGSTGGGGGGGVAGGGDSHGDVAKGESAASLLTDTTLVKGPSTTMLVHGMSCPLCAKNVDIELRRIKGVSFVTADLGEGHVVVTLDGSAPVTRGQLARAVNDSGFTIKSFQN